MRSDSLINCMSLNASICPVRAVWAARGSRSRRINGRWIFSWRLRRVPAQSSHWLAYKILAFMFRGLERRRGPISRLWRVQWICMVVQDLLTRPYWGPGGVVKGPEWGSAARGVERRRPVGGGTLVWDQGALRRSRVQATGPWVWGPSTFFF